MKNISQVRAMAAKLSLKHLNRKLHRNRFRHYSNCLYNEIHVPRPLSYKEDSLNESVLMPRKSSNLIVYTGKPESVRLCMYTPSGEQWSGDTCDEGTKIYRKCPYFKQKLTEKEIRDSFVPESYPDVRALLWVSGSSKVPAFSFLSYLLLVFFFLTLPLYHRRK